MSTLRIRIFLTVVLLVALAPPTRGQEGPPDVPGVQVISNAGISDQRERALRRYGSLIHRLVDVERLAELPAPGEKFAQWSSYDRASRYDAATGKYVNWDANGDGNGIIRHEGDRVVMAEMKGPGCIWRIWSAAPGKGHVKIYLDSMAMPAVDMPFEDYFDGKHAPFNYPALSYNLAADGCSGQNLYFPIPYGYFCKIVADKDWGNYYHFGYATYPRGTGLQTFSADLVKSPWVAIELKHIGHFFEHDLGTGPVAPTNFDQKSGKSVEIGAGETALVGKFDGPAAIKALRVKMSFADRADEISTLRKLALRITWDDEREPAVWCPLGDFFGTAPGVNHYKSLLMGMTDEGFYSYWYMPFAKHAVVELVNDDKTAHKAQFEIITAPLTRAFDGLGYFHCKWHRDTVELPRDRWPDWQLLDTQGRGRFCGVMLHVWNPRGGWWGEGDEKFFVDGEKFPSTFGTGSEDYFGYAWSNPHLFQKPYHAQTFSQNNQGHQSLLRLHVADNVPFDKSFEGCIEKYFKNDRGTLYAATVWWYLAPGGKDPYGPVPVAERDGYYVRPPLVIAGFKVLNESDSPPQAQAMGDFGKGQWKNDEQLWWTGGKPGDTLALAFQAPRAGKYEIAVFLTKARDYGIVQFSIDDAKAGKPIDLYNPDVVPSGPIRLGSFDLAEGQHRLTVKIVGANPEAVKAYMFGIDRIDLVPKN